MGKALLKAFYQSYLDSILFSSRSKAEIAEAYRDYFAGKYGEINYQRSESTK
jgi:hypothetical protein